MRVRSGRGGRAIVVGLAGALLLAACGGGGGGSSAQSGSSSTPGAGNPNGRFSIEISEPQKGLVPGDTNETAGAEVLDALFTGLVDYDVKTSAPRNAMAESIESKDNKVWKIALKPGYTFHNGEPVTATSFVNAWNYSASGKAALQNSAFFARIKGFEATNSEKDKVLPMSGLKVDDDRHFTITLKDAFSQLPIVLGYTAFYPLPKVFYDNPQSFGEAPIGDGPFKMNGSWVHKEVIKVDRYDNYSGDKAKSGGIDFKIYQSLDTAYNDLRAGNLDVMDSLPPSALATAQTELGSRYIDQPSSVEQYIGFPTFNKKYTADFRKAVSMAIDRGAIAKAIFNGTRAPATGFVSPIVDGARANACGDACTYNPDKAKQLYQQSGWTGTFTIAYNEDGGHKEWIEAVKNQLTKNLGLQVETRPYPSFDKLLNDLQAKKLDAAFRMGWSFDYPSIEDYLTPIFGTAAIKTGSNFGGYSNAAFDSLVDRADAAATPADGVKLYQNAEDLLYQQMPYLPMFFSNLTGAYSTKVENVAFDAFTRVDKVNVRVKG